MAYPRARGMVQPVGFPRQLARQLEKVWRAYHIAMQIDRGQIDHNPALFVIDPQGRERKIYLTQMYYTGIGQQAQILGVSAQIGALARGPVRGA
jgi:hypothetical protein